MAGLFGTVMEVVSKIFKPLADLIDSLHTSQEEKMKIQAQMEAARIGLAEKMLEYEKQIIEARSNILEAEATGQSWLQRNWRPIVMLSFTGIVVSRWFGLTTQLISAELEMKLLEIVEYGIVGYIGLRTGEKLVLPMIDNKLKEKLILRGLTPPIDQTK